MVGDPPSTFPAPELTRRRRRSTWSAVATVVAVGLAAGLGVWLGSTVLAAVHESDRPQPAVSRQQYLGGMPDRLVIPALGIDAPMVSLGIDRDGRLEPPTDTQVAGWYGQGPIPGDPGTVVVAGHLDTRTGPAVFAELAGARPGDRVEIRSGERAITYEVERTARYPKAEISDAEVYRPRSGHDLRIITCGGTFDGRTRHYRDNVVVFAHQVVNQG